MKPTILIVDDSEAATNFARVILRKLGVECITTSDAESFLKAYTELKPKLCLIDLFLGNSMAGFALIEKIRETDESTPLFVVSGHSERDHVAHALELGANDYLVKPMDPDSLASKLSRYFLPQEVPSSRLPLFPVPEGRTRAAVQIPVRILEIDELGLKLRAPHLLSKGTLLDVQAPLLEYATGTQTRRLRVTQTWIIEGSAEFGAYAEFDSSDPKPLNRRSLRVWLKTQ